MRHCGSAVLALLSLVLTSPMRPQALSRPFPSPPVPSRYLVLYRNGQVPARAEQTAQAAGARLLSRQDHLGITVIAASASVAAQLAASADVQAVVADRLVQGDTIVTRSAAGFAAGQAADALYDSPQGWAVKLVGGYGNSATPGPWSVTQGAGVRIAILDTGIDASHPDLAPNLVFNLSEIDQTPVTGMPSVCDDGSAQDQTGHGTWTASLAAGAYGTQTGLVAGVAPQASLLNIKVLERLPATASAADPTGCINGQGQGLLSWVIKGIDDALAQNAGIISMSLGSVIDITTGDGAGLKTLFDQVTYAASQQGAILIAAAGNDGLGFGTSANPGRYVEIPAQSRGVLAVVAATNPACAENLAASAACNAGPVTLPYYSNYGPALNALAAPGGSYPEGPGLNDPTEPSGWVTGACTNTGTYGCFGLGKTAYVQAMGTSASVPLAAGVVALVRAAHPGWSASTVLDVVRSSAVPYAGLPAAMISAGTVLTPLSAVAPALLHHPVLVDQQAR